MEMNFLDFKKKGLNNMIKKLAKLVVIIQIVFIILRIIGLIHWSWAWVFSPIWITALIAVMSVVFDNLFN